MAVVSIVKLAELEGAKRIDAEYYQPIYTEAVKKIIKCQPKYKTIRSIGCKVVSGPFGSSLKSEAYLPEGIPFVRIQNLEDFFINKEEIVHISHKDNERLSSSQLKAGDLVLSKVGNTIGVVAIVTDDIGKCNISENNIGIKFPLTIKGKIKLFVLTFLNSGLGQSQILRRISGNAQPKLNVKDIYDIILYLPRENLLDNINDLVLEAKNMIDYAKSYYYQAKNLLLEELGLKDFKPRYKFSYTASFSKAFGVHRIDAEYYQPVYHQLIEYLKSNFKTKPLKIFLLDFQKGIEVGSENYQEEGKPFIRVSNLSIHGFVEKDQKYINEDLYQQLKDIYGLNAGNFLLTKDATPGIAYIAKESVEGIIASGILKLSINESEINKEYLGLCINSMVGKLQIERDSGGSVIIHWRPEQIKELQIPILPDKIQQKIASLVHQSHEARKKAKELLEEAKRKVEEIIEYRIEM